MEYRHFGAIGDILKHLMLCQFLEIEKPRIYCESNSAGALYELDTGFNKQYGIFHFYDTASRIPELYGSKYLTALRIVNGDNLRWYLGSPGLAMSILGNSCLKYFFCDVDEESLMNVKAFAGRQLITSEVILQKNDGIGGVAKMISEEIKIDLKDIFVHLDPYNPVENEFGRKTAVQLFPELVNKGIKVMLWFGLETLKQRDAARAIFRRMQTDTNKPIYIAEANLNIMSDSTARINPGILGCGIITGNLGENSIEYMKTYGPLIEKAYENTLIDGKYDGGLKFLFNEMLL
jgi:23S rRNA (adenine2030-N6)-methyltransferase